MVGVGDFGGGLRFVGGGGFFCFKVSFQQKKSGGLKMRGSFGIFVCSFGML